MCIVGSMCIVGCVDSGICGLGGYVDSGMCG